MQNVHTLICYCCCNAGYEVTTIDDAVARTNIFVTATGCCSIIRPEHFMAMKENAICCNIGHFDCEVDRAWLESKCKKETIKPQVGKHPLHIACSPGRVRVPTVHVWHLLTPELLCNTAMYRWTAMSFPMAAM